MSFCDHIEAHACIPTTMELARERAAMGAPEGTTITALSQTAGRGRRSRTWFSPPGAGVWMTTVLWPQRDGLRRPPQQLALVAGVAVADALLQLGCTGVGLKWPNDLLWHGRKVAGVLLEAVAIHPTSLAVLVGIGLNVWARERARPAPDIARRYAGLEDILQRRAAPKDVLPVVLRSVERWYRHWRVAGLEQVLHFWRQHDLLLGKRVTVGEAPQRLEGRAWGLDSEGRLRVKHEPTPETPGGSTPVTAISGGEICCVDGLP